MKTVLKILTALAAIVGVAYVVATYGDKIVAWCKNLLGACPCSGEEVEDPVADEAEFAEEAAAEEVPAEEAPAEEPVAEEEPAAEEAPVEEPVVDEAAPVADEEDFEG